MPPIIPPDKQWRGGPGGPRKANVKFAEWCRSLFESPEYRAAVETRIIEGRESAQIVVAMLHYAYGKPPDTLKLKDDRPDLGTLSSEELRQRAQKLAEAVVARRIVEEMGPQIEMDNELARTAESTTFVEEPKSNKDAA